MSKKLAIFSLAYLLIGYSLDSIAQGLDKKTHKEKHYTTKETKKHHTTKEDNNITIDSFILLKDTEHNTTRPEVYVYISPDGTAYFVTTYITSKDVNKSQLLHILKHKLTPQLQVK